MNEIKSLKSYTNDAIKIIIHRLGNSKKWITDENIAMIVDKLVYADMHFDETKGSLNNFRYHSAMIAIKRILANKKRVLISLNEKISNDGYDSSFNEIEFVKIFENKKDSLDDEDDVVDIDKIINHECLTELEKFYLKEYYIHGKKQVQIAKERGVTNRAVSFKIIEAIKKLKGAYNVKNK